MSLDTLNRIVGEAIINASFCRALLSDPGAAVRDYELGSEELALLTSIRAGSVDNLAQQIIAGLDLERVNTSRLPDLGGRLFGASSGHYPVRSAVQGPKTPTPFGSAPATAVMGKLAIWPSAC
jgi:hypothetical protein